MWEVIGMIYVERYEVDRTRNVISCFRNHLSGKLQNHFAAREQIRTEIQSDRTIEESGDFIMWLYMREDQKEKDRVSRKAPPFRYVDASMFLSRKRKWFSNAPGILPQNEEGSNSIVTEGPEEAETLEVEDLNARTEIWDREKSNEKPQTSTQKPRPRGVKASKRIQPEKSEAVLLFGELKNNGKVMGNR